MKISKFLRDTYTADQEVCKEMMGNLLFFCTDQMDRLSRDGQLAAHGFKVTEEAKQKVARTVDGKFTITNEFSHVRTIRGPGILSEEKDDKLMVLLFDGGNGHLIRIVRSQEGEINLSHYETSGKVPNPIPWQSGLRGKDFNALSNLIKTVCSLGGLVDKEQIVHNILETPQPEKFFSKDLTAQAPAPTPAAAAGHFSTAPAVARGNVIISNV
jgi:hypothetical protein